MSEVSRPQIGQWYQRLDKGESFQVTGYDDRSKTVETQSFDGDLDEIDEELWYTLPLALAEPPEDWTGPVDDVEVDDLGYTETDMSAQDWAQPLETVKGGGEAWEDTSEEPEPEGDPLGEGASAEELAADVPEASGRLS